MPLIAKEQTGSSIDPIPEGVYIGICDRVIDLGTHHDKVFDSNRRKVLLQWELPESRGSFERDGKKVDLPRAISRRYTLSLSEKANLRRDLEAWRSRKFTHDELSGFDLKTVLGAPCQLQVVHEASREGRTYATIAAIMALPKGTPKPKPENPLEFFSFDDSMKIPSTLPDWIQDIMKESNEYKLENMPADQSVPEPGTDEPPMTEDESNVPF